MRCRRRGRRCRRRGRTGDEHARRIHVRVARCGAGRTVLDPVVDDVVVGVVPVDLVGHDAGLAAVQRSVVRVGDGARRSRTTGQRPAERGVPEVAALDDHIDAPAAAATRLCSCQVRRADDLPRDRCSNLNPIVRWIEDRQRGCARTPACGRRLTQRTRLVAGLACWRRRGHRPRGGRR